MAKRKKEMMWVNGSLSERTIFVFFLFIPIFIIWDLWNPYISLSCKIWDT